MEKDVVRGKFSQIFTLDLIGMVIILTISVGIFLSYYIFYEGSLNLDEVSLSILDVVTINELEDFNEDMVNCYFGKGEIEDSKNSVIKQSIIVYISNLSKSGYDSNCNVDTSTTLYKQLVEVVVSSYVPKRLNVEVLLSGESFSDEVLFERRSLLNIRKQDSDRISKVHRSLVVLNQGSLEKYKVEVVVWK